MFGILLKPAIIDEVEEFDAVDRVGEGGWRRGGAGSANALCD